MIQKIKLSVLESAMVSRGKSSAEGINASLEVARHVEKLGFERIWFAEHHNVEYIASSAPQILITYVAGNTNKIRVGSGGIMLPNHTPLLVAEQFGTLDVLFPNRIDLGLGRAPGTDQATAMALRKNNFSRVNSFEADVQELRGFFDKNRKVDDVHAFPGEGQNIPLWILGSSTDSAYLAAKLGLPYSFASHFAPSQFEAAINIYRANFIPSKQLEKPYVMAGINVVAADSDDEAAYLMTTMYQLFLNILTNRKGPLEPPGTLTPAFYSPEIKHHIEQMLIHSFVGNKEKIARELSIFISKYKVDELMLVSTIYDHQTKLKSFSIVHDAIAGI